MSAEARFSCEGVTGEGPTSVFTYSCWQDACLKACLPEVLNTLLALGGSSLVPGHVGFSDTAISFIKTRRECANKTEVIIFYKLIMEVASHYLSFILLETNH